MTNAAIVVDDEQVIKLILDFLGTRQLHKCLRSLEKETGVVNCGFSDDVLFLRQLILDGEWESGLIFGQSLESLDGFDLKSFRYLVLKQKFMEVLYFKSGIGCGATSYSIEDLIKCLNQLEKDCPNKEEYDKLCWLLTVPNLLEQPEYRNWRPETARIKCFEEVLGVLRRDIPVERLGSYGGNSEVITNSSRDRLVNLLVKGLCFESCVEYCQQRAINGDGVGSAEININRGLLKGIPQETTGNFLSWLKSLDQEAFTTPFKPLSMEVEFRVFKKLKEDHSNLFRDNRIISRSLHVSGRRASMDMISQLSKSETKSISNSYSAFSFHGVSERGSRQCLNAEKENVVHSAIKSTEPITQTEPTKGKDSQNKENNDNKIPSSTFEQNEEVKNSILSLKQEQKHSVLSKLEEHQKQQKELQKQLMELSNKLNSDVKQLEETVNKNTEKIEISAFEKSQNVINMQQQKNSEHGKSSVGQETYVINSTQDVPHTLQINLHNLYQDKPAADISNHGNELDGNQTSSTFTQALTSTPVVNGKGKIKTLTFEESNVNVLPENSDMPIQPVTPGAELLPVMTPKDNRSFAGHWIALADGSGVLNTSTPKSCRQKMSETPAPPASPVLSVDGQTPITGSQLMQSPFPLSKDVMKEKMRLEWAKNGESPMGKMEKGKPAVLAQQFPPRKGPKINGVRRTLLPQGEANQPLPDREKKATSQAMEGDKVRLMGTASNLNVHAKSQPLSHRKLTQTNSVPLSKPKLTQDKPESKQSNTFNVTYQKQATAPPSNTTVVLRDNKVLQQQRELLRSSSQPRFCAVATLEDVQAIRAVAFHPRGEMFAVGSNSKTLRICTSDGLNLNGCKRISQGETSQQVPQPTILTKINKHHKGSIYCIAWSCQDDLIASGSNDKSIKMIRFDAENCTQKGNELEMNIHAGTVRDLSFVSRPAGLPMLVSGGAADGNILISDCNTGQTVGTLQGHAGAIMAVYAAGDDIIASGSADHTVRLWDLRSQRCIDVMATGDSGVASVCVNHLGTLLASGHEDGSCMIYDITAGRTLQLFKPHNMDCRTVRFSPDSQFLLTGSYDSRILLMDVKQNLEGNTPPYYNVAGHRDKVIQCRWHPSQFVFLSSSADRTASLWTLEC